MRARGRASRSSSRSRRTRSPSARSSCCASRYAWAACVLAWSMNSMTSRAASSAAALASRSSSASFDDRVPDHAVTDSERLQEIGQRHSAARAQRGVRPDEREVLGGDRLSSHEARAERIVVLCDVLGHVGAGSRGRRSLAYTGIRGTDLTQALAGELRPARRQHRGDAVDPPRSHDAMGTESTGVRASMSARPGGDPTVRLSRRGRTGRVDGALIRAGAPARTRETKPSSGPHSNDTQC